MKSQETLLYHWEQAVRNYGNREYVVDDRGKRYTYLQLDETANRLASYLQQIGVVPQDVVAFQLPVWSEFVVVTIACLKVGAILNPLGMCYMAKDLEQILKLTKAKVYIGPTWFRNTDYEAELYTAKETLPMLKHVILIDTLKEKKHTATTWKEIMEGGNASVFPSVASAKAATTKAEEIALILCTSGTTGGIKGAMFTHSNVIFSEEGFNKALGLTHKEAIFMPAPLNHATGFHHGIIAPMLRGAKVVLQQRFHAASAIELMNQEQCYYSMGSTPFIYDLLKEITTTKAKLTALKLYLCGGAPVPSNMVEKAHEWGINLCEVYGTTESVPHVFVRPEESYELNGTTSGRPMEGVEIRVVDERGMDVGVGEIGEELSRGPQLFVGYIGDEAATKRAIDADGWFHSGDLCTMDAAGNIHIIGRKKDMIVRGGENLNANQIDSYLEGCPGIKEHTVVGMPDERLGERICAYLVLEEDKSQIALEDLIAYLKEKGVAKRYWPEHIECIEALPKTLSGKVKKYVLVADLKERKRDA